MENMSKILKLDSSLLSELNYDIEGTVAQPLTIKNPLFKASFVRLKNVVNISDGIILPMIDVTKLEADNC